MNKPLKYFAAASLLLNVALAGVIIGHAGRDAMGGRGTVDEIAAALPDDKRALLQDALKRAEADTTQERDRLNEARKKAAGLLMAEPFDRDAYLAEWKRMIDLRGPVWQRNAEAIADVAARCTPQERAVLADILRRPKPSLLASPAFRKN